MSSTTTTPFPNSAAAELPVRRAPPRRLLTVVATIGAALVGWVIARPIPGVDMMVRLGSTSAASQRIGPTEVIAASASVAMAGWALLAVLERFGRHASTTWTAVALGVLAPSFAGPAGGVNTASEIALASLHLIVAAVLISGLRRSAPRR